MGQDDLGAVKSTRADGCDFLFFFNDPATPEISPLSLHDALPIPLSDARVLGASLLASAGILGVVVGIAARPLITNLLAGVQILFSEPIRLDDVVVVEGEWGHVEEIRFTYVVVRIWDDRRLLLPISYFVDHPFQNWTRSSADLLATVTISADFMVPVEAVREELHRILER